MRATWVVLSLVLVGCDYAPGPCATDDVGPTVTSGGPGCEISTEDDMFPDVLPGTTACFDLFPRTNTIDTPHAPPTLFSVTVSAWGDEVTWLDERTVYFITTWRRPLEP